MKSVYSNEDYEFLNDLLSDFLENPPIKYKRAVKNLKKFNEKIETEYIELIKPFEKYYKNLYTVSNYEKYLSYQLGTERGKEIANSNE